LGVALQGGFSVLVLVVVHSMVQMCCASLTGLWLLHIFSFLPAFLYLLEDDTTYLRGNQDE